ncbi:MAG: FAS1-like dehydratase domain-containing protein [Acidimicrobiales bacterium]
MSLTDPADQGDLPDEVAALIGVRRHVQEASFAAEQGHGIASCASVQNGNPLFWDDDVADELTGGPILPPTTLSLWSRPHSWDPELGSGPMPLPTHFDLKERFGLPDALVSAAALTFLDPVRPGDVMTTGETLRSVSAEKDTAYGPGRFWVIDVDYANQSGELVGVETFTGFGYRKDGEPGPPVPIPAPEAAPARRPRSGPSNGPSTGRRLIVDDVVVGDRVPDLVHEVTRSTVVLGAMAARDWRPMHHDPTFARERSGVPDVFLDTPTQQAWLERHLTDWTGPTGRLGRIDLRMGRPVVAGDTMTVSAEVGAVTVDVTGCGWITLVSAVSVSGEIHSRAAARIAVPAEPGDNPWSRRGADWLP